MPASDPAVLRHSLQICASLVENPTNLGALCRTAEVFRLETLVLPDLEVSQEWAFRQVAASAHRWQPLEGCSPDQLTAWIRDRRAMGYGVFALSLEEAACSLPKFAFPLKSAVILGRELTGVPSEVLEVCEGAIAIPQFGQVESLNVHTAAAIAIYEYLRQHALPH